MSYQTKQNITVSNDTELLTQEQGSTAKHWNFNVSTCIPAGNYNVRSIQLRPRFNSANISVHTTSSSLSTKRLTSTINRSSLSLDIRELFVTSQLAENELTMPSYPQE